MAYVIWDGFVNWKQFIILLAHSNTASDNTMQVNGHKMQRRQVSEIKMQI